MLTLAVKPKRLLSQVGLLAIAGLFLAAFLLLKSGLINSTRDQLSQPVVTAIARSEQKSPPDPLELAYLKIQHAAGEITDAQLGDVIVQLLRAGRADEARQLLSEHLLLSLTDAQRLLIDLELAHTESPDSLAAALSNLVNSARVLNPLIIRRAIELSRALSQEGLSGRLFDHLAMHEQVDSVEVYRECGQFMQAVNALSRAADCYRQALSVIDDSRTDESASLRFDLKLALLPLLPADSGEQNEITRRLLDDASGTDAQLETLASTLLAIERPQDAYRIYARLAIRQPQRAMHWLPLAARWAEAANRLLDAAVLLESLAKQLPEAEQPALFYRVEKLLLSAGQTRAAYQRVAQRLQQQKTDVEALKYGVRLALQVGEIDQAMQWNERILTLHPNDPELVAQQVDLALAGAKTAEAMIMARRLVQLQPADAGARERLAQISEWNNEHATARAQWLWLTEKDNQPVERHRRHALKQVWRLSKQLFDFGQAAQALRELSLLTAPDYDQISELVRLYVLDGQPLLASQTLKDLNIVHGPTAFALRTLAVHEYSHGNYQNSLAAWKRFESLFGVSTESVLMRIELLWRLDQPLQAVSAAAGLKGQTLLSQASDYQLRLLAEIGWQYRQTWLMDLSRPYIAALENRQMRIHYGRRLVESLLDQGREQRAKEEAVRLWSSTAQQDFAFNAMELAVKAGDRELVDRFAPDSTQAADLQDKPAYWVQLAAGYLQLGKREEARAAYERALKLDSGALTAITGLLWMTIGDSDIQVLQHSLDRYAALAEQEPALWQVMAVGYLQLGAVNTSVDWFNRALDQISTDYGMLLTYADALEYSGRASDALRVRDYTLQQLRPVLLSGTQNERDLILRQYVNLSLRYAGAAATERLVDYLLAQPVDDHVASSQAALWRDDIAISWLMATQRSEQARVLMANLHSKRLQTPAWQRLALALQDGDRQALQAIIDAGEPLSVGNQILALRQLGKARDAYALAQRTLDNELVDRLVQSDDIRIAAEQYPYLRQILPGYASGGLVTRRYGDLNIVEQSVSVRHTLPGQGLGLGLQMAQRRINTQRYVVDGADDLSDLSLSLYVGNGQRGGRLTAGLLSTGDQQVSQAATHWYLRNTDQSRRLDVDLAYNDLARQSPELLVAGLQHRASVAIDAQLGKLPFLRLQADTTRLHTREDEQYLAEGLAGRAELGLRGSLGAHTWSASVQSAHNTYRRAQTLPDALQITQDSALDSVLSRQNRVTAISASFARGGIDTEFPIVSSPRYQLGAQLGYDQASKELGLNLNAGIGFRIIGGDELSFSVKHDTRASGSQTGDVSMFGFSYRYHF